MATRAKATKKPAIGNPSSDAVIQQEPVIVAEQEQKAAIQQEPVIVAKQEQNAISGLSTQGRLPKPRIAGTRKRRKRQPKKSLLQNPLVAVGMGVAAILLVSSFLKK